MDNLIEIWNYAVEENLINFLIFLAIILWVFKKADITRMLSGVQDKIAKLINDAKKAKADAQENLELAQQAVENLPAEIDQIEKDAQTSAERISKKVLDEANMQVESIKNNADKVIAAEEKLITAQLTKSISKLSAQNARSKVKQELSNNAALHEKYINQSIDELDRLNF